MGVYLTGLLIIVGTMKVVDALFCKETKADLESLAADEVNSLKQQ